MFGSIIIPLSFSEFVIRLVHHDDSFGQIRIVNYLTGLLIAFFSFSVHFIQDVQPIMAFGFWPRPGIIFYLFHLYFVLNVLLSHLLMFAETAKRRGLMRKQIFLVFMATTVGFLGGMTNHFLWYAIKIPPFGNVTISICVVIMAYAIVAHRLMDIEVIIKKALVFAGIVGASACAVSIPVAVAQFLLGGAIGVSPFWLMISGIAIAVLIYRPLERSLLELTDKYLFQKKVDYRKLLKEATEYLSELASLKWQARRVIAFLVYKARIKNASLYAYQSHAPGSLLLQASRPRLKVKGHRTIAFSHPLLTYMLDQIPRGAIQLAHIEAARKQEQNRWKQKELWEIIHLLKDHQAEAAIPCFTTDTAKRARKKKEARLIRGVLFLGPQKSDEVYKEEDLDVFFTLGQESSIAFENARLYDEQILRAHELERTNQELNNAQTMLMRSLDESEQSRKEAEKSREAQRKAKEEALEAKKKTEEMEVELIRREKLLFVEKLVKGIAHEIFNPLQPVVQYVDRLNHVFVELFTLCDEFKYEIPEEGRRQMFEQFDLFREATKVIEERIDHLYHVVDTLSQMSRADDQSVKSIDFKIYWTNAVSVIQAQTHGDTLQEVPAKEDIPPNLPPVMANAVQLTQVFLNLYRNAIHAMDGKAEKEVSIRAWVDESDPAFLTISFSDTGSGIPTDMLPRIFDFGFSTKGTKGQGIGLNMCKTIIERFGGTIRCESEFDKGTTFLIRLPIAKEKKRVD